MIQLNKEKNNTFDEKTKKNYNLKTKLDKIKKYISEYEETLNFEYIECPICKSNDLISYGTYERHIAIDKKNTLSIKIKRVMCKNCRHTHAIIPTFIKPYFVFESSFIDYTIIVLENKRKMAKKTILKYVDISRQLLYQWRKRYEKHKVYLKTTFNVKTINEIIKVIFNQCYISEYNYKNHMRYYS